MSKKTQNDLELPNGFDEFVTREIQPVFDEMQLTRKQGHELLKKWGIAGFSAGLGLAVISFFVLHWPWFVGVIVLLLASGAGLIPGFSVIGGAEDKFEEAHIAKVTGFLGLTHQEQAFHPPRFDEFLELKLLKRGDRQKFRHLVTGSHEGQEFSIYEAKTEEERVEVETDSEGRTTTRRRWVTLFHGQLLHSPYPRKFACTTVIARDAGWFNFKGKFGKKLKPMGLADPKFEKLFEVYTSDQVEGRYLVDPTFMERLLELEDSHKKRRTTAAFSAQSVYVALNGSPDFFGDLGKNSTATGVATMTVKAFSHVFHFLEKLKNGSDS